jgi:hypothetical protein
MLDRIQPRLSAERRAAILAVVYAVAAYLPARRASQVDSMAALRTE